MKNTFFLIAIAGLISLTSCSNTETTEEVVETPVEEVVSDTTTTVTDTTSTPEVAQ